MNQTVTPKKQKSLYPLPSSRERLALLQSIKGMWKRRKPDPVKELKKLRQERERALPSLRGQQ